MDADRRQPIEEIERLRSENADLKASVERLTTQNEQLTKQVDKLTAALEEARQAGKRLRFRGYTFTCYAWVVDGGACLSVRVWL